MNNDTHGSNEEEWIAFDLDGTLAKYDGWKGIEHIGEPIASTVLIARLLNWMGKKVKILTARAAPRDGDDGSKARAYVEAWCEQHLGFKPEVTHLKDASMVALFDDRAVAVEPNTGKILGGWPDALPKASEKARKAVCAKAYWMKRLLNVVKRRNPDADADEILRIALGREKKAEISLGDGNIDDVRKVISELTEIDREKIIGRGRTEYKDLPKRLAGRTVAYENGVPVGFSDIWGMYDDGRVRPSPTITVAVSDRARGNGLAARMTRDAMRKVIDRVKKIRQENGANSDYLRRFVWRLHNGNNASARAAESAGFKEQKFDKPHSFRQFVLMRKDFDKTTKEN